MAFVLKNALATYRWAIDTVLTTVRWKFSLSHLSDIFVFSSCLYEHIDHLSTVLALSEVEPVPLQLSKTKLFHKKVDN